MTEVNPLTNFAAGSAAGSKNPARRKLPPGANRRHSCAQRVWRHSRPSRRADDWSTRRSGLSKKCAHPAGRSSGCSCSAHRTASSTLAEIEGFSERGAGRLLGSRKRSRTLTGALVGKQMVQRPQKRRYPPAGPYEAVAAVLFQRRVNCRPLSLHDGNRHFTRRQQRPSRSPPA